MQNLSIIDMQLGARRLLFVQILLSLVLALVTLIIWGRPMAVAVLLGGLTYLIANFIFIKLFFRTSNVQKAQLIVTRLYLGEFLKLVIAAAGFIFFVKTLSVAVLPFVIAFFIVQSTHWLSPIFFYSSAKRAA